jgi:hypothetical protein
LTSGLTASSAVFVNRQETLKFSSLKSENALGFCQGLAAYLGTSIGGHVQLVDAPWQAAERTLYVGGAQLGAVCGLQYVLALDSGVLPGVELLLRGEIDTTAIDCTVLEQELRTRPELSEQVRVIETLGPSPMPPIVASRALPAALRERVRAALLSMHLDAQGAAILEAAGVRHFVGVDDADYDPIRHMASVADIL